MADINKLVKKILKWEGGAKYTNNPIDKGGPTKYGITLDTWKNVGYDKNGDGTINSKDIKLLTEKDFQIVLKKNFWDKWKGDMIKNQSLANLVVDWLWCSGKWGIIYPQRALGIKADGIVGNKTISSLNNANQEAIFKKIWNMRKTFFLNIVKKNPCQKVFIKGWLNRLNDFKFEK